jgi:hypothetical protein
MVDFDPNDHNIPQILRNRFTSWVTAVPRLQYSQYGPINKYLNLKFPDAMVKPQGLMRPIMSEREVEIVVGEEGLLDVGNVSIDSTGALSWNMCTLLPLNIPRRTICLETGAEALSRFHCRKLLRGRGEV